MLHTFAAPFDFHNQYGGRRAFNELAAKLASQFASTPQVIDDPIFSYTRSGKSQLQRISELNDSQPAVVYLSNVVMHSSIMTIGDHDLSDLRAPLQYDSLGAFLAAPYVRGYPFGRDKPLPHSFEDTTIVVSDLATFRDDNDGLPEDGLFQVLKQTSDLFVCHILDHERYFAHCSVYDDQPVFFLSDSGVDLDECIRHYHDETLREFLLSQSIPFATLGDDHMDDEYVVSYGLDCWQSSDDHLCFAR